MKEPCAWYQWCDDEEDQVEEVDDSAQVRIATSVTAIVALIGINLI